MHHLTKEKLKYHIDMSVHDTRPLLYSVLSRGFEGLGLRPPLQALAVSPLSVEPFFKSPETFIRCSVQFFPQPVACPVPLPWILSGLNSKHLVKSVE